MPAAGLPVASTTTSTAPGSAGRLAVGDEAGARDPRLVPADAPAGGPRPLRVEIGDDGDLEAGNGRHLRQEHRAEFSGADQAGADGLAALAAGFEEVGEVHPGSSFRGIVGQEAASRDASAGSFTAGRMSAGSRNRSSRSRMNLARKGRLAAPMARAPVADRAFDDRVGREALRVERGELVDGARDDALPYARRKRAVDHRRLEVDHRQRVGHGVGDAFGRAVDPVVEMGLDRAPVVGRLPDRRGIAAGRLDRALEPVHRGDVEKLPPRRTASRVERGDQHLADGAGIAAPAGEEVAVEDNAAADEPGDEDVEHVGIAAGIAEEQLGGAGGGRIVAGEDRKVGGPRHLGRKVEPPPALHGAGRRADLLLPVPQLEGRGDAEPGDPSPRPRRQASAQRRAGLGDEVDQRAPAPDRGRCGGVRPSPRRRNP